MGFPMDAGSDIPILTQYFSTVRHVEGEGWQGHRAPCHCRVPGMDAALRYVPGALARCRLPMHDTP